MARLTDVARQVVQLMTAGATLRDNLATVADQRTTARAAHEAARTVVTTADAQMGENARGHADLVLIKPITFSQLRDLTARLKPQN